MSNLVVSCWRSLSERRRKYAVRGGIGFVAFAVLVALVIFVLPTPLARWIIDRQLEAIGVRHDGIETIDIDLWNSKVRAGPLRFSAGGAEDGRIGNAGFNYSFGAVLQGRAFLQRFFVSGVDVRIARRADGTIAVNGVSLAAADESAPDAPEPDDGDRELGFGVEQFAFSDSVLVFEDVTGGTLAIAVDLLTFDRLFTWTPQEPARFALAGSVNEMELSLEGTVVPFGDPLRFTLDARIGGITIGRMARFVGPAELAREDGTLDTQTRYDYEVYRDGRVEGRVNGVYRFSDIAIATGAGETAAMREAALQVDLVQKLAADGSVSASGGLSLEASSVSVAAATGDSIDIGGATLTLADIAFDKSTAPRATFFDYGPGGAAANAPEGHAASLIALTIGWARQLALDALSRQLTFDGRPRLDLRDVRLTMAARGDAPGRSLAVGQLQVDLAKVDSETVDAGFLATFAADATVQAMTLTEDGGGLGAEIATLRLASKAVDFSALRNETRLALDIAARIESLRASDANGSMASFDALSLDSAGFRVERTADTATATGPLDIALDGLAATLADAAGNAALRGDHIGLSLAPLTIAGGAAEAVDVAGDLDLSGIAVTRGGDVPLSLAIASSRTSFRDIRVAPLGADAALTGAIAAEIADLALEAGAGDATATFSARGIVNDATAIRATGLAGDTPSFSATSRMKLSGLQAAFPVAAGVRAEATLAEFAADLSAVEAAGAGVTAKGDLSASRLMASTDGETPDTLEIAAIALTGLDAGSDRGIGIGDLAVDNMRLRLALPLPGGAAGKPEAPQAATAPAAAEAPQPAAAAGGGRQLFATPDRPVRLGRFRLSSGSTIAVVDGSTAPPFDAVIAFDTLALGPVDTAQPGTRTALDLAATINEAATLRLEGWISAFGSDPQLDAKGRVESLNLPFLSPFVAPAVGVNIESGDISATVAAATREKGLAGQIDVRVDDLFVVPISEQEAERLQASVGVPVGFAVSVLKNGDGVIDLGFPLLGSLADPQVDFSEAIDKAISGALASVFPLNWFGKDGNSFSMQPATFAATTDVLTEEGQAVVREIGALIAAKPDIRIRVCGRAARADLLALRAGDAGGKAAAGRTEAGRTEAGKTEAGRTEAGRTDADKTGAAGRVSPPQQPEAIRDPDAGEIEALLALASLRGAAIRRFMAEEFGIGADRLQQCRTTYSIEDGREPRAEFQF